MTADVGAVQPPELAAGEDPVEALQLVDLEAGVKGGRRGAPGRWWGHSGATKTGPAGGATVTTGTAGGAAARGSRAWGEESEATGLANEGEKLRKKLSLYAMIKGG